jgi:hypothetical protein
VVTAQALGPLDATQQRRQARHHLTDPERLGEVVVRPDSQTHEDVGLLVAGSQHQYRNGPHGVQPSAHLVAVEAGKHHVEQDGVGTHVEAEGHRARAVEGLEDVVSLGRDRVPSAAGAAGSGSCP